jgi:hypothetical protein
MSFFNKKEEVLKIELTQYGKLALANGTFRPHYYAFYDDDILYDRAYASVTEVQNDIQDRILFQSRLKPSNKIYGAETRILETNALGKQHDGTQQLEPNKVEKDLLLRNSLYDIEAGSANPPDFYVYVSGDGTFDTETGITKTTGSFTITEVDNIKCNIDVTRVTTPIAGGPPSSVVYGATTTFTFKESFEFCKDEEYEVSFFEIDHNPASEIPNYDESEVLKNLYFNSLDSNHAKIKLADRFVVTFDDAVPPGSVQNVLEEECQTSSIRWGSGEEDMGPSDVRNIYEDADFELPDCDNPDGGEN